MTNFKKFISNKKLPDWLKTLIFIVINIIFLYKSPSIFGGTNDTVNINPTFVKWFFILGVCSSTTILVKNLLSLFLFIMFSKYNWNKPVHLPQYLLELIDDLYELRQEKNKGPIISLFLREIIIYLILLIICICMLYLISI